jgi:hypothetical protein
MRFLEVSVISVTAFVVVVSGNPATTVQKCGLRSVGEGNVWGGENTKINAWPWLVAFLYRPFEEFFCSGSLITAKHVVSGEKS